MLDTRLFCSGQPLPEKEPFNEKRVGLFTQRNPELRETRFFRYLQDSETNAFKQLAVF